MKLLFKCQQAMLSNFFLEICALLHTDLVYINVNCVFNMHLSITNAHIPWPLPSFTLVGQGFSISFIFFCRKVKKTFITFDNSILFVKSEWKRAPTRWRSEKVFVKTKEYVWCQNTVYVGWEEQLVHPLIDTIII